MPLVCESARESGPKPNPDSLREDACFRLVEEPAALIETGHTALSLLQLLK